MSFLSVCLRVLTLKNEFNQTNDIYPASHTHIVWLNSFFNKSFLRDCAFYIFDLQYRQNRIPV